MDSANTSDKRPWASKTLWTNLAALASLIFPPVREWLASNPVEAGGALAAANVLLRFVTSGRISLSSGPRAGGGTGGFGGSFLVMAAAAGVSVVGLLLLPSCSFLDDYRVGGGVQYIDPGTGAKGGLRFDEGGGTLYGRVPRYDPETGELVGWADVEVTRPAGEDVKETRGTK